ncbi:MAG: hypothetical protein RLZZ297_1545 [Chloroflexota bacterium]
MERLVRRVVSPIGFICAVALLGAGLSFFLQGWIDISLWDEGFLWYGAQRVLAGDVPIRDFYAYDIGRYFVLALPMAVWGNTGIVALRFGLMLLQALVLAVVAEFVYRRVDRDWRVVGAIGLVAWLWVWPHYRMPDFVVLVVGLVVLARIQRTSHPLPTSVLLGLVYGVVLVSLGDVRKHGVFFVACVCVVLALRAYKQRRVRLWLRRAGVVLGGFAVGVVPLVLYALMTRGFLAAYITHMIEGFFAREQANIPLPVPWPWVVALQPGGAGLREYLIGVCFVVLAVGPFVALGGLLWRAHRHRSTHPFVQAAVVYSVPSVVYAFSRADLVHLAQGLLPLVLGGLVWIAHEHTQRFWVVCSGVLAVSLIIFLPVQPRAACPAVDVCRATQVGPDILSVPNQTADEVALLNRMRTDFVAGDETLFIAPFWPGAYAMLSLRAPVWDIYAIWPRSEAFQRDEIAQLTAAQPRAVIIMNKGMDDRSALRFSISHELVYTYIRDTYDQIEGYTTLPGYSIFRIRDYD